MSAEVTDNKNTKPRCVYCGNNPTNHTSAFMHNTFSVFMQPMDRKVVNGFLGRQISKVLEWMKVPVFEVFKLFGIVKYIDEPVKFGNERSQVIWDEAKARGIKIQQMIFAGRPIDVFKATIVTKKNNKEKNKTILFKSLPRPMHMETESILWMDDKMTLKKNLIKAGVPVARGGSFWNWGSVEEASKNLTFPLIVKPRLGSRGRHTSTYLYNLEDLKKAYEVAKQICFFVIVEEHLVGSVYRGTVVGGELYGVLKGDPPRITGDGVKTVGELIIEKNENKADQVKDVKITPELEIFIGRSGYKLNSVLEAGKVLDLSEKIGLSYGGDAIEVTPETHPRIKEILAQAGRAVDDPVIGFDFIIEDITSDPDNSLKPQKWGIIEANSLPFINLHHFPRVGAPINVAAKVWDLWER